MDRKQEKELLNFRKKLETRNPKPRAVLQMPEQQRSHSFPRQRSGDEAELYKPNGCAMDLPQPRKTFTSTDKEIEQLVLFESEAKMKTSVEKKVVVGVSVSSKTETKMSLNQIKESQQQRDMVSKSTSNQQQRDMVSKSTSNQQQRDMVSKSTSSIAQMRKGPTPPPQVQTQQLAAAAGAFPAIRNPSFTNLTQMPSQSPAPSTNGTTTNFPSNVAPWGGSQQEISQWKATIDKKWTADSQSWMAAEGVRFPTNATTHFVPVTNVNNQPFAPPPTGQKQQVPHR
jgi:hypothetical protein